jgi:glutamine---fructose-6-phosphate transaminase (isomerizing)
VKKAGKVANLRSATETVDCVANVGIAHTRWATHGKPDDTNAHPHFSADKTIAVVHNGIIENYRELKERLETLHGYKFASQTDTELLAHLAHFVSLEYACKILRFVGY